jgi:hypothetical protein
VRKVLVLHGADTATVVGIIRQTVSRAHDGGPADRSQGLAIPLANRQINGRS